MDRIDEQDLSRDYDTSIRVRIRDDLLNIRRPSPLFLHATICNIFSTILQQLLLILGLWIITKDSQKFVVVPSTIKKNALSRRNLSHERGMLPLLYLYDLCICVCRHLKLLQKLLITGWEGTPFGCLKWFSWHNYKNFKTIDSYMSRIISLQ